uniref:Uncharacterized protein n=1 Tax=Alexandrium andersonii TaxID=327968 RepID=A0A7S2FYZ5_9DINO|mmetsp:Transcript_37529/g.85320  ORF Transcript_37529/g.85320 Transcript_37529/m.85320 type:complete len:328 (+) Transcript_37529:41-1024(+)
MVLEPSAEDCGPGLQPAAPVVDLSTPSKDRRRGNPAGCADGSGLESNSEDAEDSPQLPLDWLPLEYELLEYIDCLPADLAERVSSELEAQERHVAHLRAENAELRHAASQALLPEQRCGRGLSVLAESARQLEAKARQVRQAAECELLELSRRSRTAEARQRRLSRDAVEDAVRRRRLWEAEAETQRIRSRVEQLEGSLQEAERRAGQRDEEEKELANDIEQLQAEVREFRAKAPEFKMLEQREQELRRQLWTAKTAFRAPHRGCGRRLGTPAGVSSPPKALQSEVAGLRRTRSDCRLQGCWASPLLAIPTPTRGSGLLSTPVGIAN